MIHPRTDLAAIEQARRLAAGVLRPTPLVALEGPRIPPGIELKLEVCLPTASFKLRGVFHAVQSMTQEERARGLATVSAGNTATALAWAARHFGVRAASRMPDTAPQTKIQALRDLGGTAVLMPVSELFRFLKERGWEHESTSFVHPWIDVRVHAGHGSLGLEILEQCPQVQTVFLPVGGGGLLAGVATALKARAPSVRIVAVEPQHCPSLARSLEAGRALGVKNLPTLCDGVAVPYVTEELFPVLQELVDDVVLVSEKAVRESIALLARRAKVVAEGAGALALAAALQTPFSERGICVCPVTGGNLDPSTLLEVLGEDSGVQDDRDSRR